MLHFQQEELAGIRAFALASEDCEQIGENEFVMDLYDLEKPITLDIVLSDKGIQVDGAAYLKFDEEMDGWYMDAPIKSDEDIRSAIIEACLATNQK